MKRNTLELSPFERAGLISVFTALAVGLGPLCAAIHASALPAPPTPVGRAESPRAGGGQATDPLADLKPVTSGAGIVVCEPTGNPELLPFGAGCARWVQFQLCGSGELGRTPLFSSIYETQRELSTSGFPLSLPQALDLSQRLGATHAAVGSLSGSGASLTLKYQLYALESRQAVGAPAVCSGDQDHIVKALPALVKELASAAGARTVAQPVPTRLSPAQVAVVGAFPIADIQRLTTAESLAMAEIATLDPLCLDITLHSNPFLPRWAGTAALNLPPTAKPTHLALIAEIAADNLMSLEGVAPEIERLKARYPNNVSTNTAYARLMRSRNDLPEERKAAEMAVRCSPGYPQMWSSLGQVFSDIAESTRRGRFSNELTESETKVLNDIYPRWLVALVRAGAADDRNPHTWSKLATAATFVGEKETAFKAYDRAIELDPSNYEALYWGSEMFQPKWFDAPDRIQQMLKRIATGSFATTYEALGMTNVSGRFGGDPAPVLARFEKEQKDLIGGSSDRLLPYLNLIELYAEQKRYTEALDVYEKLFARRYDDFDLHERAMQTADSAHDEARKARLKADWPQVAQANLDKATMLGKLALGDQVANPRTDGQGVGTSGAPTAKGQPGRATDAVVAGAGAAGAAARGKSPATKPPVVSSDAKPAEPPMTPQERAKALYKEAMALSSNNSKAVIEQKLRQAIRLDPKNYYYPAILAGQLSNAQRTPEALAAINEAIRLCPKNTSLYETKWGICINMHDNDSALAALKAGCSQTPRNGVYTYGRLAQIYIAAKDYDNALITAEHGLECYEGPSKYEAPTARAGLLLSMGDAFLKLGRKPEARAAWHKAVDVPGGAGFGGDVAAQRLTENP